MRQVLENNFYRTLLLWATIFILVAYAWMISSLTKPRLFIPTELVKQAAFLKNHEVRSWPSQISENYLLLTTLTNDLSTVREVLSFMGSLPQPVDLVLNADEPSRYFISDSRIELGLDVAKARGQLAKAFIKVWLLQNADANLATSVFRREVLSDVLLASIQGKFLLQTPLDGTFLAFPETVHVLGHSASFLGVCASPWAVLEVKSLCASAQKNENDPSLEFSSVSMLSFRSTLGAMLWRAVRTIPLRLRIRFVEAWVSTLQEPMPFLPEIWPRDSRQWRAWILNEFKILAPLERIVQRGQWTSQDIETVSKIFHQVLGEVRLEPETGEKISVYTIIKTENVEAADLKRLSNRISQGRAVRGRRGQQPKGVVLVETGTDLISMPGLARLSMEDRAAVQSTNLIWESCRAPALSEILDYSIPVERILFVSNCGRSLASEYDVVVNGGLQTFVGVNREASFILLRTEPLKLAEKLGVVRRDGLVTDLILDSDTQSSKYLGVSQAKWDSRAKAFRVLGAIEAVEAYRGAF